MKKKLTLLFVTIILAMTISSGVSASSAKVYNLRPKRTYQNFDLDGDGQKDSIRVDYGDTYYGHMSGYGYYLSMNVYINGKLVFVPNGVINPKDDPYHFNYLKVQILHLKNGKNLIFFGTKDTDYVDCAGRIYTFQGKKWKKLLDIEKKLHLRYPNRAKKIAAVTVKNNTITAKVKCKINGKTKTKTFKYKWSKGKLVKS